MSYLLSFPGGLLSTRPMMMGLLMLAVGLTACADDGDGTASTPGSGQDSLPKRGELPSDPTIVSARAECRGTGGPTDPMHIVISVQATDAMGGRQSGLLRGHAG